MIVMTSDPELSILGLCTASSTSSWLSTINEMSWKTDGNIFLPPHAPTANTELADALLAAFFHDNRAHIAEWMSASFDRVWRAGGWVEPHHPIIHQYACLRQHDS